MVRLLTCLFSTAFLIGCASTVQYVPFPDQKVSIADSSKCRIYVYRPSTLGSAVAMNISDNGTTIGKTGPHGFLCWERDPGTFTVTGSAENTSSVQINSEQAKSYYILQHVMMGILEARNRLEDVDLATGSQGVMNCSPPNMSGAALPATANPPVSMQPNAPSMAVSVSSPHLTDTVYMKTGEIIPGAIIEETPGNNLKIRLKNGSEWVLYFTNIDRIVHNTGNNPPGNDNSQNSSYNETPRNSPATVPVVSKIPSQISPSSSSILSLGFDIGLGIFNQLANGSNGGSPWFGDNRTGFVGGGVIEIQPNPYFSIQPGIVYSSRGCTSGDSISLAMNYLTIPIEARVKYPLSPTASIYSIVGLNLGILLSATYTYNGINEDWGSYTNAVDFGIELGGGMEFPTGKVTPFIEADYYLGLTNVFEQSFLDAMGGATSFYMRGLEIKGGLKFPL